MPNDDSTLRLSNALRSHKRERAVFDSTLDRYELQDELGRAAWDRKLPREVAMKFLHPHLETSPEARERFQRKWRAAAQLVHPNLVTLLDAGEDDGRLYLVMERIGGESLQQILSSRRLDLATMVRILERKTRGKPSS